jgi:hypothetical protein
VDQVLKPYTKFGEGQTFVASKLTLRPHGLPTTQAKRVTTIRNLADTIWNEGILREMIDRMGALIEPIVSSELSDIQRTTGRSC